MNWHVWIKNTYCGTVRAETHQDAIKIVEDTHGPGASLCVYRADASHPALRLTRVAPQPTMHD